MATTSPDNIWTPDSGDDYALTVDLAATADTVQDALTSLRDTVQAALDAMPFVQSGSISFSGDGTKTIVTSITFPEPFASPPDVIVGDENTSSRIFVSKAASITTAGAAVRITASDTFYSSYSVPWIAVGKRP